VHKLPNGTRRAPGEEPGQRLDVGRLDVAAVAWLDMEPATWPAVRRRRARGASSTFLGASSSS
jgi:hypothetical protein